jgi:8-oxo-dGTP diphosphatase
VHATVSTLVYALRDGRVALLRRRQQPNLGLWTPPGGKVEPGESPLGNALRELREETGLAGQDPRLRAVVSELDPVRGEAWLMFVFRMAVASDELGGDGREGEPAWVDLAAVPGLPQPPADAEILAAVLDPRPEVAFMTARYDDGRLVDLAVTWSAP